MTIKHESTSELNKKKKFPKQNLLKSWSDFMTNERENSIVRTFKHKKSTAILNQRFRNSEKSKFESFYSYSMQLYSKLSHIKDMNGNTELIKCEMIFEQILTQMFYLHPSLPLQFYKYYKNTNCIFKSCSNFDNYLNRI